MYLRVGRRVCSRNSCLPIGGLASSPMAAKTPKLRAGQVTLAKMALRPLAAGSGWPAESCAESVANPARLSMLCGTASSRCWWARCCSVRAANLALAARATKGKRAASTPSESSPAKPDNSSRPHARARAVAARASLVRVAISALTNPATRAAQTTKVPRRATRRTACSRATVACMEPSPAVAPRAARTPKGEPFATRLSRSPTTPAETIN